MSRVSGKQNKCRKKNETKDETKIINQIKKVGSKIFGYEQPNL